MMMLIFTGNKGCGKTLFLKGLIADHKIHAQGFLSVKKFSGTDITGIDLLLLPEQKSLPMATTTPISTESSTFRFYFYPDVFSRVNMHFHKISQDLPFVFDEFGLLEMDHRGHYLIFEHLERYGHKSLIVVRRDLVEGFISTFCNDIQHSVVDLETCGRLDASTTVLDFLNT
ncbi:MAG TPA: hypothetical protein ENN05_11940 [Deltaproteobacteria bacterium]|nr:hypothetical protein [Deltaproteobacteria bacterium]